MSVGVPMGGFPILDPFIRTLNRPKYVFLPEKIYLKITNFVRKNPEFIKKIRICPDKSQIIPELSTSFDGLRKALLVCLHFGDASLKYQCQGFHL